jgi:formylglycine-generating enzyme required for sulfatase activity
MSILLGAATLGFEDVVVLLPPPGIQTKKISSNIMKNKGYLTMIMVMFMFLALRANNISVTNVAITDDNPDGYALVRFDLSWENSWRVSDGPSNWDAAWVFVKYRVSGGEWRHAWLNDSGHDDGTGTAATMDIGLKNDKLAFDASTNPGIGAMVYRSATGHGSFAATGMTLRWNYGANGISYGDVEVKVFGVEMVLIPEGPYWLGDGVSTGTFRQVGSNTPFQVTTNGAAVKANDNCCGDTQLNGVGIWLDGDGGISKSLSTEGDMNVDYPTGYRGYYMMKYEISQGQYRDFLNTLTRAQQNARTATDISGTSITNRYVMSVSSWLQWRNSLRCDANLAATGPVTIYCDLDGDGIANEENDGEWLACNFMSWDDGISYLDWSGLRPMTELEYEKACRGPNAAVGGEFAWGNTLIAGSAYSLSSAGRADEGISENYSTSSGNASYSTTDGSIDGPLRVGIFSGNGLNSGRMSSGAGYYGVMEMSGNLWERVVTVGNTTGRSYEGEHGDGELSTLGLGNETSWPVGGLGGGFRGGDWFDGSDVLRVSDRNSAADVYSFRGSNSGFRGCRSVAAAAGGN